MKRVLLPSKAFLRTARRLAKRHPATADDLQAALELLAEDAHHPALRTHKLKGKLAKSWACSAGYDLRIVFQFVPHGSLEAILLEARHTRRGLLRFAWLSCRSTAPLKTAARCSLGR